MLERLWRKGNSPSLLVGTYIDTATMKINIDVPQKKLKIELLYDPGIPPLGIYLEKTLI